MNATDIVNNNIEKTTTEAFYNACGEIHAEISVLSRTAMLLFEVGNDKLAKRLENVSRELEFSVAIIEKYAHEIHALLYERGNESSNNLLRLGMELSKIIDDKNRKLEHVCTD